MLRYIVIIIFIGLAAACRPPVYTPKPPGYFKIDTPAQHRYQLFDRPGFPYSFEYPVYSEIQQDTIFIKDHTGNPYWINIFIPKMNGVINITYKDITAKEPFDSLVSGSWALSFFHHERADYIDQVSRTDTQSVSWVLYTVGGNVATKYQFTVTDSVKHFIRGALYFDVTPNADSLKPATDFLLQDIGHLLGTIRWRDNVKMQNVKINR